MFTPSNRHYARHFICPELFNPSSKALKYYYPHFISGQTETQRGYVAGSTLGNVFRVRIQARFCLTPDATSLNVLCLPKQR